ncbi:MAG: hypothetical protein H6635_00765 [Anaerolineales bacterium]|nr:hypothetical protein [Anaerolineales bacterium]
MRFDTSVTKASELTAANLRNVAKTLSVQQLSRLTLPEIEAVVQAVSKVIPAGNVPGMILSGLARLPGRRIPMQKMKQDVTALFSGLDHVMDQAVYGAFFAGPAAVLWGYQNLLKLAGKDPESAFPEGTWQFYADYALREDTARHVNETHGFDSILKDHNLNLSKTDRLTAWFMASVTCLHQYNALLQNEWRERVAISLLEKHLRQENETQRAKRILREWELQRPYKRSEEGAQYDYPTYRRKKFEAFIQSRLQTMPEGLLSAWKADLHTNELQELAAYQQQMSILAYLEPGPYGETRIPFRFADAKIGVIHHDSYYMLPVVDEMGDPLDVLTARAQIAALLTSPFSSPSQIASLAKVKRTALAELRSKLNPVLVNELDNLKFAPILLSTDIRSRALPLSELRHTERGVGSHALTIFDTSETFVFDQSHIFFDGAWGTALAEIMTNEALSWARYLSLLPPPTPTDSRVYTTLTLQLSAADLDLVQQAPKVSPEAAAETDKVDLKACLSLRKLFKQRNERIELTINDLLVLYRAIHAATYTPTREVVNEINALSSVNPDLSASLKQLVMEGSRINPAILIPMDASLKSPRDRIFPLNIEVPLADLNLFAMHSQALSILSVYESAARAEQDVLFASFKKIQKAYLSTLAGFGVYLSRAKEMASQGDSTPAGAIKLLAHLPLPIQRLLDKIPEKFEVLNHIIKGREVLSNVGAVAATSTLTRFMTAKDDNNQKQLAWGIITDANAILRIHLRDFRPHVQTLMDIGRRDLANLITQDYLNAYAEGLNRYVRELSQIASASHETMTKPHTAKGRNIQ